MNDPNKSIVRQLCTLSKKLSQSLGPESPTAGRHLIPAIIGLLADK